MSKIICGFCNRKIWFWQKSAIYPSNNYVKVIHLKCLIKEINEFGGCESCNEKVLSKNWKVEIDDTKFRKPHFYHTMCPIGESKK